MSGTKKKRGWVSIFLITLLILIVAGGGVYLYAGWVGYQESPKMIDVQISGDQVPDLYTFSPEQEEQLSTHGYPDAFTILFYDEETVEGTIEPVRLETWDYYYRGIGLTFINGEKVSEDFIDIPDPEGLDPLPYSPDQFTAYMSLEEIIAAGGIDTYVEIPLDKEFLDGATSYFAYSLAFGLKDDELIYVEALALQSAE